MKHSGLNESCEWSALNFMKQAVYVVLLVQKLIRSREINGVDSSSPWIREVVLRKESGILVNRANEQFVHGKPVNKCNVLGYKHESIRNATSLAVEEPAKPWMTLKRNIKNVKYLSSLVDIRFKNRYVYVDVGARNYGSSIGSWFMKQYPKQNKTFEIYAIEADRGFHEEYRSNKGGETFALCSLGEE
ncbi:hypothetical protein ACH5RR_020585 [Cinchona calisaya]|uniref:DUF7870 domain-containing protein n=1 Tax=Cinchona calisaya TaxID=153742 RepID=A0ABD2ZEX6_9GENT